MSTTRGATVAAWWPWLALPAVATGLVSAGLALGLTDPEGNWIKGQAWVNVPLTIGFSTVAAGIWSTRPHQVGVRRLAVLYTVVGLGAACDLVQGEQVQILNQHIVFATDSEPESI